MVLSSGQGAHAKHIACGLFAVVLEGYAASRPEAERRELGRRYPALARFVPSLRTHDEPMQAVACPVDYHLDLIPAIVRLLTDLGRRQPVLLILGEFHDADPFSLDLVRYLAHLAVERPWLMVGAVREEEIEPGAELGRMLDATMRERLCLRLELHCLPRRDCDQLVRALLPGVRVGDEFLTRVYAQSRGNPLFVGELIRQIYDCDDPALDGADAEHSRRVPSRVRELATMRLAAMDETLVQVLGLAAPSRQPSSPRANFAPERRHLSLLSPPPPFSVRWTAGCRCVSWKSAAAHLRSGIRSSARHCTRASRGTAGISSMPRSPPRRAASAGWREPGGADDEDQHRSRPRRAAAGCPPARHPAGRRREDGWNCGNASCA